MLTVFISARVMLLGMPSAVVRGAWCVDDVCGAGMTCVVCVMRGLCVVVLGRVLCL